MSAIGHGGALDAAIARWGGTRGEWLDLSTGINPVPTPHDPPPPEAWTRLPDAGAERALEDAARIAYDVPPDAAIVAAPGTQAILQMLPRVYSSLDVVVVGPTYAEHARCWRLAGHRVREAAEPVDADVLVVVNPNNPDGRDRDPAALVDRARVLTVVDEAFRDATPERSVVPLGGERTVALKSLGKFHGLAGLRLGHAVGVPAVIERLGEALGPWAVSGPALHVGAAALAADRHAMAAALQTRSERLFATLAAAGLSVAGRNELFALVSDSQAGAIYEALAARHVLVRPFDYRSDWLRFGLPGSDAAFTRLEAALVAI